MADAFRRKMEKRLKDVHANAAFKMRDSVTIGSDLTGSPGVIEDTGNLKLTWLAGSDFQGPMLYVMETNAAYAKVIEEGVGPHGPITQRSEKGGFHAVKLTKDNFDRILKEAVREEVRD